MALNVVTKEISGIEVSLDPRITNDLRFFRSMTEMMRVSQKREKIQKKDPSKAADITLEMMDKLDDVTKMLFGSRKSVEEYQAKLAEKNDGFLEFQTWLDFVMDVVTAYQKN